ncbi:MAG: Rab family GTPase, partial [Promethearchaeota archaeon]
VTIGLDIGVKDLKIEGNTIVLQIWDFGGEERFRFLLPSYARGAAGGIFMFDVTRRPSLRNLDEWLDVFRNEQKEDIKVPLFMVGGKSDLLNRRIITEEEARELAKDYKFSNYFECSAKTGNNVDRVFDALAREIMVNRGFL